ncbi:MAG: phosphatase PAP2 family protein [Chloroflexota bacterium]|nr:phosphatase PAP2 family protein [Chloroflexota bacterium]
MIALIGVLIEYAFRQARFYGAATVCTIPVAVAAFALAWAFPRWPGDEALLTAVQGWQSPPLTAALGTLTRLGWYPVSAAVSLAVVAVLLWRKLRVDALLFALAVASALLTHPLKALVGRPRPEMAIVEPAPHDMGFPSGHAAFAILLCGALIFLTWQHVEDRRLRWGFTAALVLLIVGVGLSRVYLGVHWPSDVVGGYLFGASVLLTLGLLRSYLLRRLGRSSGEDTTFPKVGI